MVSSQNNLYPESAPPSAPPSASAPTQTECNWALLLYVSNFILLAIGPFIIWLIKKDESPYLNQAGKDYINLTIVYVVMTFILSITVIGAIIVIPMMVLFVVLTIQAAIEANKGGLFQFPPRFFLFRVLN